MAAARIGPNAIIQVAAALVAADGAERMRTLFACAGLRHHLDSPTAHMEDEDEVVRLHARLRESHSPDECRRIARAAGLATGDYLLAHRIPRGAQRLLRGLPATLASRAMLAAIGKHAWTFAGSGTFRAYPGPWLRGCPVVVAIEQCPLCRGALAPEPICDCYAATFERLYGVLVSPAARVREVRCHARGDTECAFEILW